jgi:hypothetical protein
MPTLPPGDDSYRTIASIRHTKDGPMTFATRLPERRDEALKNPTVASISRYLGMFSSQQRADMLLEVFDELGTLAIFELFWPCVHEEWPSFDAIDQRAYARTFRDLKALWSRDFWTEEERAAFDALPDPFTAYWGGDEERAWIYCWTLDIATAEGFALGHRGVRHSNPEILHAPIRKSNVCMFLTDRGEDEVVLFRRPSGVRLFKKLEPRK